MVIFSTQGSLGVSYLAFSAIKDPNKPFLMKNPNFYCSIECLNCVILDKL